MLNNLVLLNGNSKFQEIHIVINGFMSDEKEDYEAKDWKNGLKNILDKDEQKYIFKWESGLDYSKLRNHLPFKNGFKHEMKKIKHLLPLGVSLSTVARLNPFMILPTSFSFYLEEWKISMVKYL